MLLNAKLYSTFDSKKRWSNHIWHWHGTGIGIDVNSTETTSHEGCVQSGAVNNINFTCYYILSKYKCKE